LGGGGAVLLHIRLSRQNIAPLAGDAAASGCGTTFAAAAKPLAFCVYHLGRVCVNSASRGWRCWLFPASRHLLLSCSPHQRCLFPFLTAPLRCCYLPALPPSFLPVAVWRIEPLARAHGATLLPASPGLKLLWWAFYACRSVTSFKTDLAP